MSLKSAGCSARGQILRLHLSLISALHRQLHHLYNYIWFVQTLSSVILVLFFCLLCFLMQFFKRNTDFLLCSLLRVQVDLTVHTHFHLQRKTVKMPPGTFKHFNCSGHMCVQDKTLFAVSPSPCLLVTLLLVFNETYSERGSHDNMPFR